MPKGSSSISKAVGRENLRKARTSENQSRRRLSQIAQEESLAEKMRELGYEIFSPTVVCDRVAVKDGKVYFVEFKKIGQKLRPGQQLIHDLVPEMYIVKYE